MGPTGVGGGGVPILGGKPKFSGAPVTALVRRMEPGGFYALSSEGTAPREAYVDADELVAMIRVAVHEDLEAMLLALGLATASPLPSSE